MLPTRTRAAVLAAIAVAAMVLAGNPPAGQTLSIDPYDLIKGRRILGTWGGETDLDSDIPRYAAHYRDGSLPLDRLITHEFDLAHVNDVLDTLERGEVGRAVIALA